MKSPLSLSSKFSKQKISPFDLKLHSKINSGSWSTKNTKNISLGDLEDRNDKKKLRENYSTRSQPQPYTSLNNKYNNNFSEDKLKISTCFVKNRRHKGSKSNNLSVRSSNEFIYFFKTENNDFYKNNCREYKETTDKDTEIPDDNSDSFKINFELLDRIPVNSGININITFI